MYQRDIFGNYIPFEKIFQNKKEISLRSPEQNTSITQLELALYCYKNWKVGTSYSITYEDLELVLGYIYYLETKLGVTNGYTREL